MNGRKKRVLLVDDEVSFTRLLRMNLEQTGTYEVREENVGSRALAAAKEFRPDIILLDIIMPDVDGGSVVSQLRSSPDLKETKVVFLTAVLTKQEANQKSGQLHYTPCLAKPVNAQEVIECIERYV
ncbi:MAG: response regulator [Candidatus Omnitrophica bacterium]|nr:response regulator [Candidatus Omnitrophota bacterium]